MESGDREKRTNGSVSRCKEHRSADRDKGNEDMNTDSQVQVSIIVPVYNTSEYLKQCVRSLLSQSYTKLEILLVDDGSTDESGALCDRLARGDERIRVFHKENGGLISSWKYGTERSTGEYLCFVDSDDWVDSRMIEEMMACTTGNTREIIASDYVIERDNGTQEAVYQQLQPGIYSREAMLREVLPNVLGHEHRYVTVSRCMKLIARELVLTNMHYCDPKIRMGEDLTILLPCLLDCERLVVMDHKAYYHYRYVTDSMIHGYDRGLYENIQRLRRIIECIIREKCDTEYASMQYSETEQKTGPDPMKESVRLVMPDCKRMLVQAEKEYLFLLLLAVKNEARGNPSGYAENIKSIAKAPETREVLKRTEAEIREPANRLLYAVLKHPNPVMLRILRLAMIWYYRKA